jgi:hypothetical protein
MYTNKGGSDHYYLKVGDIYKTFKFFTDSWDIGFVDAQSSNHGFTKTSEAHLASFELPNFTKSPLWKLMNE